MIKKFIPTFYSKKIDSKLINFLNKKSYKNILIDLDNTIIAHKSDIFTVNQKKILNSLLENFNVIIVSNSHEERLNRIINKNNLNIKFLSTARKPLIFKVKKIIKENNLDARKTIFIGDQLLTDILCANRLKLNNVLIDPITKNDVKTTKINRKFENIIIKRLSKKKYFNRSEEYEL